MTKDKARIKANKYLEWAEKAEQKSKDIYASFQKDYGQFDWTEPIKIGHHSQRKHEKVFERRNSVMKKTFELEQKAKRFREKADNLTRFANTNKGDAENKRQAERDLADTLFSVGSEVVDWVMGKGIIKRVNKKTYTIEFQSGWTTTRDKSFIKLP